MSKYTVRSSKKAFEVDVIEEDGQVAVDDAEYRFDFIRTAPHIYSLIFNDSSFHFYLQVGRGSVKVVDSGIEYTVFVEDDHSSLLRSLQRKRTTHGSAIEIRAPMPGLATKVEVRKGIQIEEGEGLVILEAMKMEDEIRAPARGIVTEVLAEKGEPVERDELLLRMTT